MPRTAQASAASTAVGVDRGLVRMTADDRVLGFRARRRFDAHLARLALPANAGDRACRIARVQSRLDIEWMARFS